MLLWEGREAVFSEVGDLRHHKLVSKKIFVTDAAVANPTAYNKNFKRCIGTGRMSLALRQDYMDNLKIIQREIGFDYIRGHGLFHDDMGVYRETIQVGAGATQTLDAPIFSFKSILKVFDNFRSVSIRPFVEFGFMPKQMAQGDSTVFWWQGNVTEPRDMDLWNRLVGGFLHAVVEYYGLDEVRQWYFEVWNEPCAGFWQPTSGKSEEEYYRLYSQTARTVKEFDSQLRIGGPATQEQGLEWIPRFVAYCKTHEVPLDFVSHHIYTGRARIFDGEFGYMTHVSPAVAKEKYQRVQSLVNDASHNTLPLHITEWNTSYSCIDQVHDTAFNAAYVAFLLTHVDDLVQSYAYWVFCDVFEEADVPRALFHGGFGLLTENGIRKPTFHAFAFANRLKDRIIHLDQLSCVTQDEQGDISILLFNPCLSPTNASSVDVEIEVPCPFDEVVVTKQCVDDQRGNAFSVWKEVGRPRWPNKDALDIISKAQYPSLCVWQDKFS